jgi:hypothetical protein
MSRQMLIKVTVKPAPQHAQHRTLPEWKVRLCLPAASLSLQGASPGTLLFERGSFTRLKVLLNKSFSSAILSSRRSNFAIF